MRKKYAVYALLRCGANQESRRHGYLVIPYIAIEMDIDVEYLGDQIQNGTYLHTFASVAQRRANLLVRSGHSGGCKSTEDAERECHKLGDLRCKSDHDGMRGVRMLRRSKQEELTIGYDPSLQSRFSSISAFEIELVLSVEVSE